MCAGAEDGSGTQPSETHEGFTISETLQTVVACCQVNISFGDVPHNRQRGLQAMERAVRGGANVLVLPELSNSGYFFESQDEVNALAEHYLGDTVRGWLDFAARHRVVVVGGFLEKGDAGGTYNSAAIMDHTGLRGIYRKVHLWGEENRWFIEGQQQPVVIDTVFGRIAVMICYDAEFPEWVRLAALAGAEIVCVPSNWIVAERPNAMPAQLLKLRASAATNRVYLSVCDRAGDERGRVWAGSSAVISPDGHLLSEMTLGLESIVESRIDLSSARKKVIGTRNDVLRDRRVALYGGLTSTCTRVRDT